MDKLLCFLAFTLMISEAGLTNQVEDSEKKLDITFISEGFNPRQLSKFLDNVREYSAYLLTFEPFRSRASQIAFHRVDNLETLECARKGRSVSCNHSSVHRQTYLAGVPADVAVVIVNTKWHCGSGDARLAVVCNDGGMGKETFVHEIGHSFGGLLDEYVRLKDEDSRAVSTGANCYPSAPAPGWQGVVELREYHRGCTFPHWYRSSENSIMRDLNAPFFNRLSQAILNEKLDLYIR
jgi:hypothetical protein